MSEYEGWSHPSTERSKGHYFPGRAKSLCWAWELEVLPNPNLTRWPPPEWRCCRRCLELWRRRDIG